MRTLVIIPTFNEAENLSGLCSALLALDVGAEVLVVDDSSPDGTGEVADELARRYPRVRVLHRPQRLGIGSAYRAGFATALERGFEATITMDGDWSHNPRYVPDLLAAAAGHDLAIGSRYLNGISVVNWSLGRLILSQGANLYARTVAGLPFRDCTSGFQCIRRRALAAIGIERIRSNGYSFLIELKFRIVRGGFASVEVPIIFAQRRHGRSKITRAEILRSIVTPWRLRLGLYR